MLAIAKRNIYLYFRDKTAVFFSLLSVLILVALYVFFLGDLTSKGLPDFPSKKALLTSWFFAGILAVTSVTTTLGAFGVMVDDRSNKIDMDFNSSPITKTTLVSGYVLSSVFVGVVMSVSTFVALNLYLLLSSGNILPFTIMLKLIGVIILSVTASASMILLLVSFFHTSGAFASASMVIGTLIGFSAGIYIPIGSLPDYLQTIVKWFPVSHAAALFRQLLMAVPLTEAFSNAPIEMKETFQFDMGMLFKINGVKSTPLFSVIYLIISSLLFFTLSVFVTKKKKSK